MENLADVSELQVKKNNFPIIFLLFQWENTKCPFQKLNKRLEK